MSQFDSKERMEILEDLNINWPGKFLHSRLKLFSRKLDKFTNEVLREGVDRVIETCSWPPPVKEVYAACKEIEKGKARLRSGRPVEYKPGDFIPGMGLTMTPREAKQALDELLEKNPNASRPVYRGTRTGVPSEDAFASISTMIDHIMYNAYRKCIEWDDSIEIDHPVASVDEDGQLGFL